MIKKEFQWDKDSIESKREKVINAVGDDVKEILENKKRNPEGEEITCISVRKMRESSDRRERVENKFLFSYDFGEDSLVWACYIKEVDRDEVNKIYLSSSFINKFIEAMNQIVDIARDKYDNKEFSFIDVYQNDFKEYIQQVRLNSDIDDVYQMIDNSNLDQALTILGKNNEYKDHVWDMLKRWENGNMKDRDPEILTNSEKRLTVRITKKYEGEESKKGYVIGIDDTIDRFFIHQLQNSSMLNEGDPDEWDDSVIKEMMGFDKDINRDCITQDLQNVGLRMRVQGDLKITVEDKKEIIMNQVEQEVIRNNAREYINKKLDNRFRYSRRDGELYIKNSKTELLKEIQKDLDIPEEKLELLKERDDIQRLHPSRRKEYIEDIIESRIVEEYENEYIDAKEEYTESTNSEMFILGNHMIIIEEAYSELTTNVQGGVITVVPEETNAVIMHDEHSPQKFRIPQGAYMFDFLTRNFVNEILS